MRPIALAVLFSLWPVFVLADTSQVPFRSDGRGAIIVSVHIADSASLTFLLDTGASRTVVTTSTARSLGTPAVAKTEVVSSTGSAWRKVVRLTEVSVGPAHAANLLAAVLPDEDLRAAGLPLDGILGQDFFGGRRFLVDYARRSIDWNPVADARGTTLHLTASEGRYLVELPQRADGNDALRLVPDSGSDAIVLFDSGSRRVATNMTAGRAELVALGGTRSVRRTTIRSLRIGSFVLRDHPVVVIPRSDTEADGLLTLTLFRRVLFDGENGSLTLWR